MVIPDRAEPVYSQGRTARVVEEFSVGHRELLEEWQEVIMGR